MCGLCAVLMSEEGWSDASVTAVDQGGRTRRHERLHRVALANRVLRHYRVKLSDWNGVSYVVNGQTGQSVIVSSIAAVWPAVERLRGQVIDPLDERLIEALEAADA
ncbi:MAG TPA: hypothetical protein VFB54_13550 [Burkholderiales bacterium]|nr:hypothetical protein [Burkholderiales bacterium]